MLTFFMIIPYNNILNMKKQVYFDAFNTSEDVADIYSFSYTLRHEYRLAKKLILRVVIQ